SASLALVSGAAAVRDGMASDELFPPCLRPAPAAGQSFADQLMTFRPMAFLLLLPDDGLSLSPSPSPLPPPSLSPLFRRQWTTPMPGRKPAESSREITVAGEPTETLTQRSPGR
ncbi:hypothetical protein IscW_ISCW010881, partial [Ixodes scapularis]